MKDMKWFGYIVLSALLLILGSEILPYYVERSWTTSILKFVCIFAGILFAQKAGKRNRKEE